MTTTEDLEFARRWMNSHGKRPAQYKDGFFWLALNDSGANLPSLLYSQLSPRGPYETEEEAITALATALKTLRDILK